MIKGVNKQILEVTNTDSPYFERIIFFVRPESQSLGEGTLKKEAEKLSLEAKKPPKIKKTVREKLNAAAFAALGLGAGAALVYALGAVL